MTKKRFKVNADYLNNIDSIIDNETGIEHDYLEIEELLNRLAEKNKQLKQSYKEFEDECQSTFNAMSRKQNDLYRKNFKLKEENEQLKQDIENLEITIQARETLIDVCEKKFKELGYIITVDDDGYVIE